MVQKIISVSKGYVIVIIPEGKTMLEDGVQIPAPNWTISIPITDTSRLLQYLTQEQIKQLQGE